MPSKKMQKKKSVKLNSEVNMKENKSSTVTSKVFIFQFKKGIFPFENENKFKLNAFFYPRQLMGDEKARCGLSFMYNAPAGAIKDQDNSNKAKEEEKEFKELSERNEKQTKPEVISKLKVFTVKTY